ncbi:hypothetical protein ACP70R_022146 [Stipagrostis hirtigluma subsp. patula]
MMFRELSISNWRFLQKPLQLNPVRSGKLGVPEKR